jgi:hypothetical protein
MVTWAGSTKITPLTENCEFSGDSLKHVSAWRAYRMEEATGATALIGTGLVGVNGTRSSALTQVAGKFPGTYATKGDGTNICTTPQDNAWQNYWTVDFFVKFTAAELAGVNALFGRYTTGRRMLSTWCDSGKLWIYCSGAGGTINTGTASAVITADTWHHVRYTYGSAAAGSGTMTISVDGVQALAVAGVGQLLAPDGVISIFSVIEVAPASVFRGTMADFRFYNSQLPSTYTVPTAYYLPYFEALVHDSGTFTEDAGVASSWKNDTAAQNVTGSPAVVHSVADYVASQGWATKEAVNTGADWDGAYTIVQLQGLANTGKRYRYHKVRFTPTTTSDLFDSYSCEAYLPDTTPPEAAEGVTSCLEEHEGARIMFVAGINGHDNVGGVGYAGMSLSVWVDDVEYFMQADGSWSTSTDNLWIKGDADTIDEFHDLNFTLGEPTWWKLTAWDLAGNSQEGDWIEFKAAVPWESIISSYTGGLYQVGNITPANLLAGVTAGVGGAIVGTAIEESHTASQVLKSAGGDYNDDNLVPANVKFGVEFGIDDVGEYAGAGATPDSPGLLLLTEGDEQLTVDVQLNDADDPAYLLFRTAAGEWTAPSESLKATESGNVVIPSLQNGSLYYVCAVSKVGTLYSLPSNILSGRPKSTDAVTARYRVTGITRMPGAATKTLLLERVERPTNP